VLKTDFGLAAFIGNQVIKELLKPFVTQQCAAYDPTFTTLSYLTLPTIIYYDGLSSTDSFTYSYEDDGLHAESTYFNSINPASLHITAEQKKRFYTAMKLLDLKPFCGTVSYLP
jgi:hypothetical protein